MDMWMKRGGLCQAHSRVGAVNGPNEVTEYKVRVGGDRLVDEWRFGQVQSQVSKWDNRAHIAEHC